MLNKEDITDWKMSLKQISQRIRGHAEFEATLDALLVADKVRVKTLTS